MRDNLRLYRKMLTAMQGFLPSERITRLRNLAFFASGLFLAESVHLGKVARKWPFTGKLVSLTNRLRRFLKNPRVESTYLYRPLARKLLSSFEEPWQTVRLILDTTKVGFGHRVMTVSLAYRKRALPLAWTVHKGCKGHTKTDEQIELLQGLILLIPPESPVRVLGDSEFGTVKLFRWLFEQGWPHVLRTSGQSKIHLNGKWIKLGEVSLQEGQTRLLGAVRFTEKHDYRRAHLIMHWAEGFEDPWYLLADEPVSGDTLRRYEKRMWTEEMYADMDVCR